MMTHTQLRLTIQRQFQEAGLPASALDAGELVCFAAGLSRDELIRDGPIPVPDPVAEQALTLAERHLSGEPTAYLIGEWSFCGLTLDITPAVLIPRSDTEVLAEQAVAFCRTLDRVRVLDLCAGSGCIGLAVASQAEQAEAVLGELSEGALGICRRNIRRCGLSDRVTVRQLDAFSPPPVDLGRFHCLVCNPPYIPAGEIAGLDSSVRDYEPHQALDGGVDGLDFYRVIAEQWQQVLHPGGRLYLEVGLGQADAVREILARSGIQDIQIVPDLQRIPRVVYGVHQGRTNQSTGGKEYGEG